MNNTAKYLTEFIGTFFLVFTVTVSGNPLAIGAMLMVMVYLGGHISGAQYNPAVSLAVMIRGKQSVQQMLMFWGVQLLGAIVAALCAHYMYGRDAAPQPDPSINIMKPLFIEIVFTFALASVVLASATTKKTSGNSFYGLAIGFTVMAAAYTGGGISGGAYNPAVGTGPILIKQILGACHCNPIAHLWLYWVGPLIGGASAGMVYKIMNPEEFQG